jgi:inhibitor of cysteine peptidase
VRSAGRVALAFLLTTAFAACAETASRQDATSGAIGDPRVREPEERGDPAAYVLTPGETFEIRLPANPTTGFSWALGPSLDDSVVREVSTIYQPDESGKVGGGGTSVWKFAAVGPGRTRIVMLYRRPWEPEVAPAKLSVYSVAVEEDRARDPGEEAR